MWCVVRRRAVVVRGVHVRVRGAPDAARAAVRARVPRQVRRQVAEGESTRLRYILTFDTPPLPERGRRGGVA